MRACLVELTCCLSIFLNNKTRGYVMEHNISLFYYIDFFNEKRERVTTHELVLDKCAYKEFDDILYSVGLQIQIPS